MSDGVPGEIVLVCCSVLRTEVEALHRRYWPTLGLWMEDSMLHMRPDVLSERLSAVVGEKVGAGHRIVLVYGDCCGRMADLEALPGVIRLRGHNCCEMLLGHDEYRRLLHEGAFFLLSEWTHRWREVFTAELGLNHDNATGLMQDMHRKLVYLDTGMMPVPEEALQACSEYCGLPFEVLAVSLEVLRAAIGEAISRCDRAGIVR